MSTRDMTINQIKAVNKEFGAKHTIKVNGFNDSGTKITAAYVLKQLQTSNAALLNEMRSSISGVLKELKDTKIELLEAISKVNNRLDNIVVKNNLKE